MNFEEVVKMIKESEARVDEVLKAARLQRNEKPSMSKDKLELILDCIWRVLALIVGAGVFLAFMYLMTH